MDSRNAKPGDVNEDGLEIEQDGWITRVGASIKDDNRLIDETLDTMIKLDGKEVE